MHDGNPESFEISGNLYYKSLNYVEYTVHYDAAELLNANTQGPQCT